MLQTIQSIVDVVGAVSVLCGALSHVPFLPAKARDLLGEIGLDIAGFLAKVKK